MKRSLARWLPYTRAPHLPSGIEDFAAMRQLTMVDKTGFLPDILIPHEAVTVFTRPRGFMKTSIFSMMEKFLSIQSADDNRHLFDGLAINGEEHAWFREHYQGQFPVIYLSLKDMQALTWDDAKKDLGDIISVLYKKHSYVLSSLSERHHDDYQLIMDNKSSELKMISSLANLATYLSEYYKGKVIILIDDYDTPIYHAYLNTKEEDLTDRDGYFRSMFNFMEKFFGQALKGHAHVEKGFMAGILNIDFGSGFNNATFYSVVSLEFSEVFGFTESEAKNLINQISGVTEDEVVRLRAILTQWTGGYHNDNSSGRIYSPSSVVKLFNGSNLTTGNYWVKVGDNIALPKYFNMYFKRLQPQLTDLMLGCKVEVDADRYTIMPDLGSSKYNDSAFWGLLLCAGYLSTDRVHYDFGTAASNVMIPNYEVLMAYIHLVKNYRQNYLPLQDSSESDSYNAMLKVLQVASIEEFEAEMNSPSVSFLSQAGFFSPPSIDAQLTQSEEHTSSNDSGYRK